MQQMIDSGRWQAMTPAEQAGITRQAHPGHMTLEDIGTMATRANVKTVVLSHLSARADGRRLHAVGRGGEETLFRPGAHRERPDGILTGSKERRTRSITLRFRPIAKSDG